MKTNNSIFDMHIYNFRTKQNIFHARLLKMGALDVSKVVHGRQGWRLITCMWLHAGVVHLLINVLCLIFIGIRLEQEFGFGK
jgi:membrane associated rhomboid family serine protease